MFLLPDEIYYNTLLKINGNYIIDAKYKLLYEFLFNRYKIKAYNICNDKLEKQIYIVLNKTDYDKISYHINDLYFIKQSIQKDTEKFIRDKYALKYIITFINFNDEIIVHDNWGVEKSVKKSILELYNNIVWTVEAQFNKMIVFYYTYDQFNNYNGSNIEKNMESIYFEHLNKIEQFNIISHDSFKMAYNCKENIDYNFGGDLRQYLYLNNGYLR